MTLKDELAKLDGDPPYDEMHNPCYKDPYYLKYLEEKYEKPIAELRAIHEKNMKYHQSYGGK